MVNEPDKKQVEALLQKYDVNSDGNLSVEEMKLMIKDLEIELADEEFDAVFQQFDADSNGVLDPKEFMHFIYVIMNCDFNLMASMLFFMFDVDHSASIDIEELGRLMLNLGYSMTRKELESMMEQVGTRGKMNYQQFLAFIQAVYE